MGQQDLWRYHCPKNNLNLCRKTEKQILSRLERIQRYTVCQAFVDIHISGPETRHKPLHLHQPGQARLLCGDLDYFSYSYRSTTKNIRSGEGATLIRVSNEHLKLNKKIIPLPKLRFPQFQQQNCNDNSR